MLKRTIIRNRKDLAYLVLHLINWNLYWPLGLAQIIKSIANWASVDLSIDDASWYVTIETQRTLHCDLIYSIKSSRILDIKSCGLEHMITLIRSIDTSTKVIDYIRDYLIINETLIDWMKFEEYINYNKNSWFRFTETMGILDCYVSVWKNSLANEKEISNICNIQDDLFLTL
jgi:hypothetical protein